MTVDETDTISVAEALRSLEGTMRMTAQVRKERDTYRKLWEAADKAFRAYVADIYPVTAEGRLSASVLMILGIGLYSAITATLTSFLIAGDRTTDVAGQLERLAVLHGDGRLTDAEFRASKAVVIESEHEPAAT